MKNIRRRRILSQVMALAAVGLIAWGAGMIYRPLAPICLGLALLIEVLTQRGES